MKQPSFRHRTQMIGITLAAVLVVALGGLGLYNMLHSHVADDDSECTTATHSNVVTAFYRENTTPDQIAKIEASTGAKQRDAYPQKHAFSLLTSRSQQAHVIAILHGFSEVTSVQVSAAQGCIDPN